MSLTGHSHASALSQELDSAHVTIQDHVGDVQRQINDAQDQTLGRIEEYEGDYLPLVQTYDKW